jgi:D-glycero-alpha-D-manno-heptose-7-phosphate kinase
MPVDLSPRRVVSSRAPLRVSFAGGGTDIREFAMQHGGAVVSMAITKYARCRTTQDGVGFTCYPLDEAEPGYLARLAQLYPPACIETRLDVPPRSGLGASGALGVALLGCLEGEARHKHNMAVMAYEAELQMGPTGCQDHFSAAYGSVNLMEFQGLQVRITPLSLSAETVLSLESSTILVMIHGRMGSSYRVLTAEVSRIFQGDPSTLTALQMQRRMAYEIADALQAGDMSAFGHLLDEAWRAKKQQSPECTNEVIDAVYELAKKAGALGGKLSGAGGGGHMLLFAPGKEGPVAEALRAVGLRPENVTIDWKGLRVW